MFCDSNTCCFYHHHLCVSHVRTHPMEIYKALTASWCMRNFSIIKVQDWVLLISKNCLKMWRTVRLVNLPADRICTACHNQCERSHLMLHTPGFLVSKGAYMAITFYTNFFCLKWPCLSHWDAKRTGTTLSSKQGIRLPCTLNTVVLQQCKSEVNVRWTSQKSSYSFYSPTQRFACRHPGNCRKTIEIFVRSFK